MRSAKQRACRRSQLGQSAVIVEEVVGNGKRKGLKLPRYDMQHTLQPVPIQYAKINAFRCVSLCFLYNVEGFL